MLGAFLSPLYSYNFQKDYSPLETLVLKNNRSGRRIFVEYSENRSQLGRIIFQRKLVFGWNNSNYCTHLIISFYAFGPYYWQSLKNYSAEVWDGGNARYEGNNQGSSVAHHPHSLSCALGTVSLSTHPSSQPH